MEPALLPIPGLSLMFMLGLRHGFDPDHIAIIDSMAYRALGERPRLAPWTGTLFALVFDTATQAAAWGYAATVNAGSATALIAGLAFTAGMVVTDSADGRLMVRLLRSASGQADAAAYRRGIGWAVVVMSYSMALYQITTMLRPTAEVDELALTVVGCGLFLGLLIACGCLMRRRATMAKAGGPLKF